MGLVSLLRGIAYAALIATILDTFIVAAAIGSGVPVPSWAYFAPSWAGESFYKHVVAMQSQNLGRAQVNVFAFFFFYVTPQVVFIILNFLYGLFAGFAIILSEALSAVGAPAVIVFAVSIAAGILQSLATVWLFDALIAQVLGRTPFLSMIFGE